jgi:hypothetical protein
MADGPTPQQPAAGSDPPTTGYSKTTRRQYQACDQCRKSRRACDASTLRVASFPFRDDDNAEPLDPACDACSNCARTSKRCTFTWLSTLAPDGLPKGVKRKLESVGLTNPIPDSAANQGEQKPSSNPAHSASNSTLPALLPATSPPYGISLAAIDDNVSNCLMPGNSTHYYSASAGECYDAVPCKQMLPSARAVPNPAVLVPSVLSVHEASYPHKAASGANADHWGVLALSRQDTNSTSPDSNSNGSSNTISKAESSPTLTSASSDPDGDQDGLRRHSGKRLRNPRSRSSTDLMDTQGSLPAHSHSINSSGKSDLALTARQRSPLRLSVKQVDLADVSVKMNLVAGLSRIYRDSFETSLSCWVTERNCPYEIELKDLTLDDGPGSRETISSSRLMDRRIFERVRRLDKAFARLRERPMTVLETHASDKALQASVMAFASQWSHSSHNAYWRSREEAFQTKTAATNQAGGFDASSLPTEHEKQLRKRLWHDAWRAIQACAEIDSFKVILAYMLFALTQRPIEVHGTSCSEDYPCQKSPGCHSNGQSMDTSLEETMTGDWNPFHADDLQALASPPIYLEAAVRNLFSWRRKIERYRRLRARQKQDPANGSLDPFSVKDHQTFNLLFWLGVMCDTTSSAISKRPLVIPDEDCAMIRGDAEMASEMLTPLVEAPYPEEDETQPNSGQIWGEYLLNFTGALASNAKPRWPCTFEEAAKVLQEAIPVKVLMFRKVATLQTLAYRRKPPHRLEKCIQEALHVYKHWNLIYGQFMIDCVTQHNSLPPSVQSWYVILDGHWHYGCLLLADIISQLDKEGRTSIGPRKLRSKHNIVRQLCQENALAIAKIAEASLSEHLPSVPNNAEFHFPCNGSAILTEPWTDILVRAMGTACKIFIQWLAAWNNLDDPNHDWVHKNYSYQSLYGRAEECIQGMRLLGRKSDAATNTAEVFRTRLKSVMMDRRTSTQVI